jgi:hypothetical protein
MQSQMGTNPVYIGLPYIYRLYELSKFIKKILKKLYMFFSTLYVYKIYTQMKYDEKNMYYFFRFF